MKKSPFRPTAFPAKNSFQLKKLIWKVINSCNHVTIIIVILILIIQINYYISCVMNMNTFLSVYIKLYCWTSRFYTFLCCLLCKINNYIVLKINRSAVKKTFEIFINNRVDAHGWLDFYIRIFLILSIALSCNCFKFEIKATKWNSGVNSKLFWTKDSGKWDRDRIDVKIYIENFTFKSFLENCVQNILISKVSS